MGPGEALSSEEIERYDRQIRLFGIEGQLRLKRSRVLVVGVGGLGTAAALYLVAAGVGHIILVDSERVELSNLNRQILYWTRDIGRLKTEAAVEKLRELNPGVVIETVAARVDERLLRELVPRVDLVIDALDNWETRFLLNRVCVEYRKPLIHAGVQGLYGQLLVIVPGKTPCLQCLIPRQPPETRPFPILGTTAGLMAMLQVTEAIKILTGYGEPSLGRLIVYDGYRMSFHEIKVSRRPDCPVCSMIRE